MAPRIATSLRHHARGLARIGRVEFSALGSMIAVRCPHERAGVTTKEGKRMTRIVTSTYRYKRPPRKRKPVALEVPGIVPKAKGTRLADADNRPAEPAKSAIVTIKQKSRFGDAPDMTPEEHRRRGDTADALWRELCAGPPPRLGHDGRTADAAARLRAALMGA